MLKVKVFHSLLAVGVVGVNDQLNLFLIFINDLPVVLLPLNMQYCYRISYTHGPNINVIETKLQNDFHAANTWCLANKM